MSTLDLGSAPSTSRCEPRGPSASARLLPRMLITTALALSPHALAQTPTPLGGPPSSSAQQYTPFADGLIYAGLTLAGGVEPWVSDGTPGGTHQLADVVPGSGSCGAYGFVTTSTAAYFSAWTQATGYELHRTDGTQAGTSLVLDIEPGTLDSFPQGTIVWRDVVYFFATTSASGQEVWRSDGTAAGTYLLLDIEPGPGGSSPYEFLATDSMLYFVAETSAYGREVWQTDGTAAGTSLLADVDTGSGGSYPSHLSEFGGSIYFVASEPVTARELYQSNGSSTGTVRMTDLMPGSTSGVHAIVGVAGGRLLFSGQDPLVGIEIFATDGVSVAPVGDLHPGLAGTVVSAPVRAVEAGGRLFFVAGDPTAGDELWVTDGSAAGTRLVLDVLPGPNGSSPAPLVALNGRVYFAAFASASTGDSKLWVSDGTTAGTVPIADSSPVLMQGTPSEQSVLQKLRRIGDRVYFTRWIPQVANAPWYVEEAAGIAFCFGDGSEPGLLACPCGNAGAPGNGCANSATGNTGAKLAADGQHRPDEVVLSASAMVPGEPAVFFQGKLVQSGGALFGDGVRCVAGTLVRLALKTASPSGAASYPELGDPAVTTRSAQRGDPIAQGSTRLYQTWYRDPASSFCPSGGTSNVTNALSISW
jgi:ELWxxDGT repeat protein